MPISEDQAIRQVIEGLIVVKTGVRQMLESYEDCPELNDIIDIEKVVPMSLDEWWHELTGCIEDVQELLDIRTKG